MRRPLLILVLLTVVLLGAGAVLLLQQRAQPPAVDAEIPGDTAGVARVSVQALREQLATSNPPLVWDIRSTSSFGGGHIPGSRALTLAEVPDAAANLDRRQPVVTVCA